MRRVDNGGMPENSTPAVRLLAPSQVAEILGVGVDEVIALVMDGRLRGMRVGAPAQWRVEEASISTYLDDQAEEARRIALWHQSQTASFPELWAPASCATRTDHRQRRTAASSRTQATTSNGMMRNPVTDAARRGDPGSCRARSR